MRRDARLLTDHDAVGADELVPGRSHLPVRLGEKHERVRAAVALVVGREQRADVGEARCAEQRIGQRVGDDVAVGVADETSGMVDRDTPEDERDAVAERVCVDAEADAKVAHRPPPATPAASNLSSNDIRLRAHQRPELYAGAESAAGSSASESMPIAPSGVGRSRPHGPRRQWTATSPTASAGRTSLSTRSPT